MKYKLIPVTAFVQNCSLIWCEETNEAAVVDPGGDVAKIMSVIEQEGVSVKKIILTHGHADHVGGVAELSASLGVDVIGPHIEDEFWIEALSEQCAMFRLPNVESFTPTKWLQEGDVVQVGKVELDVIHTPGHTPGHIVFHAKSAKRAFVGDVIFNGAIGRTDFPKGDSATLISSIREKLFPLGDDVVFIPGHGPESSFGQERLNNPFVSDHRG